MRVLGEVWKVVYRNDFQIKQLEPLRARHYDLSCLIDACRVENREETRFIAYLADLVQVALICGRTHRWVPLHLSG